MSILVRIWAEVSPPAGKQMWLRFRQQMTNSTPVETVVFSEASCLEEARNYARFFSQAVTGKKLSWPEHIKPVHIDFGFRNKEDAQAHNQDPGAISCLDDGTYSTVEHHF